MVLFYKIWKKYNEIQLTKIKMDLNNRKMTKHPPFPVMTSYFTIFINFYLYVFLCLGSRGECYGAWERVGAAECGWWQV